MHCFQNIPGITVSNPFILPHFTGIEKPPADFPRAAFHQFNIENHSLSPFQYLFGKMILNFISRPDFISYNLLFQRDISLKLAHGLFHAPCAAWVLRSEKELEQCQKQFCMYIFENFLPKQK